MSGRLQAIFSISLLSLVAMFITPMAYVLSGTPVGLISLRRGPVIAMQVMLGCLLVVLVFLVLAGLTPAIAVAFALGIWLPVWFCAMVLRSTQSQGIMILSTGMIGLVYVLVTYAMFGDVQAMWRNVLFALIENAMTTARADQVKPVIEQLVPYMNAAMAGGLVTSIALTVMLARWWQSWVFNPGGFRQEFLGLRLPRGLLAPVVAGAVLMMAADTAIEPIVRDVLILALFLYVFHGVSVVHGVVAARRASRWWLFVMYFALVFFSLQAVLLMACIGISDSLFRLTPVGIKPPDDDNTPGNRD